MKRIVIGLLILALLGGGVYWLRSRDDSGETANTPKEATIPQEALAKYNELNQKYSSSLGAHINSCTNIDDHVYVVGGSGGFVVESFFYGVSGELRGNSYQTDVANDPNNKPDPIDLNEYDCTRVK